MLAPLAKHLKSDKRTLTILDKCRLNMAQIQQIQGHLITSGTIGDPFVTGKLISFCAISDGGDLNHAYLVFRHIPSTSMFAWNTMIRAFVEKNQPHEALLLYRDIRVSGLLPNNYTFSFLLKACIDLSSLRDGQKQHAQIVRLGWECYDFVLNGLIHMYATCDSVASARKLFDRSAFRDVISWTAMVNGYVKLGQVDEARQLFDQMPERNAVSWGTMINCHAQSGLFKEALKLFNKMILDGLEANQASVVGALSACASLGALDQGRWIHAYADRNKMELDRVLGSVLVDMYSKCGCVDTAHQVFDKMTSRDVFAWTAMISGLANHGHCEQAIKLFVKMQEDGIKPNEVTFICVLNACSGMGLVEEGQRIFRNMKILHGLEPGVEHYGCLVDLLGRAGLLEEAENAVKEMPMEPDSYVLGALLNACRMHGKVELGEKTVKSIVGRRLDHGGVHTLFSNIYASANRWKDVAKVRKDMEERKVMKTPGCSLIEVNGVSFEFVAGDRSHFRMEEMMTLMHVVSRQLESFECDADAIDCRLFAG